MQYLESPNSKKDYAVDDDYLDDIQARIGQLELNLISGHEEAPFPFENEQIMRKTKESNQKLKSPLSQDPIDDIDGNNLFAEPDPRNFDQVYKVTPKQPQPKEANNRRDARRSRMEEGNIKKVPASPMADNKSDIRYDEEISKNVFPPNVQDFVKSNYIKLSDEIQLLKLVDALRAKVKRAIAEKIGHREKMKQERYREFKREEKGIVEMRKSRRKSVSRGRLTPQQIDRKNKLLSRGMSAHFFKNLNKSQW